jgi:ankyrin repeat protein
MLLVLGVVLALVYGWGYIDQAMGWPPPGERLIVAVASADGIAFKEALRDGASVTYRSSQGQTALAYAAAIGARPVVQRLLDLGADVNATDQWGRTPLMYAAANDHADTVALLLRNGADPGRTDCNEGTALTAAGRAHAPAVVALLRIPVAGGEW